MPHLDMQKVEESELRQVARELGGSLLSVLDDDEQLTNVITSAIDEALRNKTGAKTALLLALLKDPRVTSWVLARLQRTPSNNVRLDAVRADAEEIRDGAVTSEPDDGASPSSRGGPPLTAQPPPASRPRYLEAEMPERAESGRPISVLVSVKMQSRAGGEQLKALDVPAAGATVTVVVSSPGLIANGDAEADIEVPTEGDSERHRFAFTAGPAGTHPVLVEAYRGGTYLGTVRLELSVANSTDGAVSRVRVAELSSVAFEPGEVTLQVRRDHQGEYQFQLLGDALGAVVPFPIKDTESAVSAILLELRKMAAKASDFKDPKDVRDRLRAHGVNLWTAAVPEVIQEQFWDQIGRIKTLTIAADHDIIPWELLYPLNGTNDNGFLAEQFPVVRRAIGSRRVAVLSMDSVAFVVPPGSPTNAEAEVDALRQQFGTRIADRGVFSELSKVKDLISDSPGVLHFACHNAFSDVVGSSINLEGGSWAPVDLVPAGATNQLADVGPLVFMNACRSAGEVEWLSKMQGWAGAFVKAGAGAFLGSLWAVRSSSARKFAEVFYEHFVNDGLPLGESSFQARKQIESDGGDPTWLAYTVYGNPAAVARRPSEVGT